MRKHNNFYIIGVDAGYGNMKTARTIYPTGLVAMDTKPFFDGDILEYNGTWYRIGEGHKAYNPDKTADEDFYILTLASIAAELSTEQIAEAMCIWRWVCPRPGQVGSGRITAAT